MKKPFLFTLIFMGLSFLLSALQSSLYFLPLPRPAFWFIILTAYSFRKSLKFSLLMNIPHTLGLVSFSFLPLGRLLILMNLMSLFFYFTRERFHTNHWHMSLGSGCGILFFLSINWFLDSFFYGLHYPQLFHWMGMALSTALFSMPLMFILEAIDQRLEYERIDTLENLRV